MTILLKSFLQNQKTLLKPSIICKNLTSSSEPYKKPLSVLFEEAVGLRPKSETSEIEEEEGNELKRKLSELERKLIELKNSEPVRKKKQKGKVVVTTVPEQSEKRQNLYTLFKGHEEKHIPGKENDDVIRVYKELPLEMVSFVKLLHKQGYLTMLISSVVKSWNWRVWMKSMLEFLLSLQRKDLERITRK